MCAICSNVTNKTPERRHSGITNLFSAIIDIIIINFKPIIACGIVSFQKNPKWFKGFHWWFQASFGFVALLNIVSATLTTSDLQRFNLWISKSVLPTLAPVILPSSWLVKILGEKRTWNYTTFTNSVPASPFILMPSSIFSYRGFNYRGSFRTQSTI